MQFKQIIIAVTTTVAAVSAANNSSSSTNAAPQVAQLGTAGAVGAIAAGASLGRSYSRCLNYTTSKVGQFIFIRWFIKIMTEKIHSTINK